MSLGRKLRRHSAPKTGKSGETFDLGYLFKSVNHLHRRLVSGDDKKWTKKIVFPMFRKKRVDVVGREPKYERDWAWDHEASVFGCLF